MKTRMQRLLLVTAFVVVFTFAFSAFAFYDPTIGRWASRDPVGERGGNNVYGFNNNAPINHVDRLGLHSLKIEKKDLGQRPPEQDPEGRGLIGGKTFMDWGVNLSVKKGKNCYLCTAVGTSFISYWWSDAGVKKHEERHVKDYEDNWNNFVSYADAYIDKPMSKKRADCFCSALQKVSLFYRRNGDYIGDVYDCLDYGNVFGACDRVRGSRSPLDQLATEAWSEMMQCEGVK